MISPGVPEMEMSARELRDNVEMAFSRIDTNRDGVLTREEFVASCLRVTLRVNLIEQCSLILIVQDPVISQTIANFQLNL